MLATTMRALLLLLCLTTTPLAMPTIKVFHPSNVHPRASDFVAPAIYPEQNATSDLLPLPKPRPGAETSPATSLLQKRNIGGVRLSTGAGFTGDVWYGIMPLATCIALNSFAGGNLGSFRPDEQTECYLYQGRCDANADFGELHYDSSWVGQLAEHYPWIAAAESFMCFKEPQ